MVPTLAPALWIVLVGAGVVGGNQVDGDRSQCLGQHSCYENGTCRSGPPGTSARGLMQLKVEHEAGTHSQNSFRARWKKWWGRRRRRRRRRRRQPNLATTAMPTTLTTSRTMAAPTTGMLRFIAELNETMKRIGFEPVGGMPAKAAADFQSCMAHWDPRINSGQDNAYDDWRAGKFRDALNSDEGIDPSWYEPWNLMNKSDRPQTPLYEPCNTASNLAFYYNMLTACRWNYSLPKPLMKAWVQSMSYMGMGSAMYHGSHTKTGGDADGLGMDAVMQTIVEGLLYHLPNTRQCDALRGAPLAVKYGEFLTVEASVPVRNWRSYKEVAHKYGPVYVENIVKFIIVALRMNLPARVPVLGITLPISLASQVATALGKAIPKKGVADAVSSMITLTGACIESANKDPDLDANWKRLAKTLLTLLTFGDALVWQGKVIKHPFLEMLKSTPDFRKLAPGDSPFGRILTEMTVERQNRMDVAWPGRTQCTLKSFHAAWHHRAAQGLLQFFHIAENDATMKEWGGPMGHVYSLANAVFAYVKPVANVMINKKLSDAYSKGCMKLGTVSEKQDVEICNAQYSFRLIVAGLDDFRIEELKVNQAREDGTGVLRFRMSKKFTSIRVDELKGKCGIASFSPRNKFYVFLHGLNVQIDVGFSNIASDRAGCIPLRQATVIINYERIQFKVSSALLLQEKAQGITEEVVKAIIGSKKFKDAAKTKAQELMSSVVSKKLNDVLKATFPSGICPQQLYEDWKSKGTQQTEQETEPNDGDTDQAFETHCTLTEITKNVLHTRYKSNKECRGAETSMGYKSSADDCAEACASKSVFFIYAKSWQRCKVLSGFNQCRCYCEVPGKETCSLKSNSKYDLYKITPPPSPPPSRPAPRPAAVGAVKVPEGGFKRVL
eukprot:TRINITY_DN87111_c0_g1_i1.p1 TRINITY_DN87111_c0_g1~~TRINITY_DN87111_c0_g1_i1.p1  ORF type:complete len:894 (+),score=151.86 TRINITY_DN87111_c0_g1_i1:82-2763(+)